MAAWRTWRWILEIESLKTRLKGWIIFHTMREGNEKADRLDNEGIGRTQNLMLWFSSWVFSESVPHA
ncbi:hypothetical protein QQP08_010281 [Theobroma cacao]|nr:hypothetical protein QQP08_010281 [Theobroma cacao]